MAAFDKGAYGKIVTTGDVHTVNQQAAGLKTRDDAKTFIYAFLYGAGNGKIGLIIGKGPQAGSKLRQQFLRKTPALGKLTKHVKKAAERGWIKGIDGRKMPIRSPHASLNTRLQSSGAIICKQWICDLEDALLAHGLKHGWDGDFVFLSWSHDEVQIAVRDNPELIELVRKLAVETGRAAGKPFNFKCALDVDTKVGLNWAETH
jgi:DNA polymerase I-like protein with 3'-5' exonuclease and polymerase domains